MAEIYMKNIRDWREATLMLSFEEKGYYYELLNLIYIYDDCLADHDDLICRAMPVHKKTHLRLKAKLIELGLISIKDGFYFNKRAAAEISKINEISEKNKVKAHSRWAKSRKEQDYQSAAADANSKSGNADEMLKVNVKSESEIAFINNKRNRNGHGKSDTKNTRKCSIESVLNPDGEIPEEYRNYAEEQGLSNCERVFTDWANWWVSENGRKAGARGWLQTWKARVRKDVDRQNAQNGHKAGQNRDRACATTVGARLALDRHRHRQSKGR